ncbi:MAG: NFACT RNA binding domain-containing protein [Nanoarchaeota archaeon]
MKNFAKYRWFYTSKGTLVVGGKSAEQNDLLLNEIKNSGKRYYIMHTSSPGSPFSVIIKEPSKIGEGELEECAIFTACFSQDWKRKKKTSEIHIFESGQISKPSGLKSGSWKVEGKVKKISVQLGLVLSLQEDILRAVPEKSAKEKLAFIKPGDSDKKELVAEIKEIIGKKFSEEEIISALPAGGIKIC